ncbi:hypothetical protein H5410_000357 [Solanum commersonii]|uniref:Uncharacterized protein n=1 Tax=Solanum commersonii TaxID=4109 RepID=A0A9J6AVX3_SOLCO|nr:hypothetical protein H5410_000357 [Solanum commersonii]
MKKRHVNFITFVGFYEVCIPFFASGSGIWLVLGTVRLVLELIVEFAVSSLLIVENSVVDST